MHVVEPSRLAIVSQSLGDTQPPCSQPLTLYRYGTGFNSWKVSLILEELDLPYTRKFISFSDVKNPPYVNIYPTLEDPNTNITL